MIKLKQVKHEDKDFIEIDERLYQIKENPIGTREKFWIVMENSPYFNNSISNRNFLFKYNRNDLSCEDLGEVISSIVARAIGVRAVEYRLASFEKNNKVYKGVLCSSYKKADEEVEFSGYQMQTKVNDLIVDENSSRTSKPINTVYGFMQDIDKYVPDYIINREEMLTYTKNELLKQAFFDFLLAQTDRHWFNTTFLLYQSKTQFTFRKAFCYDNGCIAFFKRKAEAIKTIANQIKSEGGWQKSKRLKDLMEKYCPMFGIKTPLVKVDAKYFKKTGRPEKVVIDDVKKKPIFVDELADELLNVKNMDFVEFFYNFKTNFLNEDNEICFDKIFNPLNTNGEKIPAELEYFIKAVMNYQCRELNLALKKKAMQEYAKDRELGGEE